MAFPHRVTYYLLMPVSSADPPHNLQLVVDFVNTIDLEDGPDLLDTPASLAEWLAARDLLAGGVSLADAQWRAALGLREALRAVLTAHNGGPAPDTGTAAELERAAERGRLSVGFDSDGSVVLAAREHGFAGALGALLLPVARGAADGSWERVKACASGSCRFAFYDRSRNRSGRWCEMAVCGNRTKVRTYRRKRPD